MCYKVHMEKKPEIMSPAGDWTCLRAAVEAGCDAVYFGIEGTNMRARAPNFSISDLPEIVEFCRQNNVKACLALNTIIYENEKDLIRDHIAAAAAAGVSGIICWDFAVIQQVRQAGIPIYISTQMSVSNSESILFLHKTLGAGRFVLARECTLEDIRKIKASLRQTPGDGAVELEVFVHGAMCVSISGRCFLSQYLSGRSGNRGECIQPCRREYLVKDVQDGHELMVGSDYILSPKDLCTIPFIEKLIDAGIDSFKIEGRNRNAEYVFTVTKAYRNAVDFYCDNRNQPGFEKEFDELKRELIQGLEKVYNRGFSSGFYMGRPAGDWVEADGNQATTKKLHAGIVTNYYKKQEAAEILVQDNGFSIGDTIMFRGDKTGVFYQQVNSMEIEHESIKYAERGKLVAVKTVKPVRRNDKVFVVFDNTPASLDSGNSFLDAAVTV